MSQRSGIVLALCAGTMAALASVCAKLATSYDETKRLCHNTWESAGVLSLCSMVGINFETNEEIIEKYVLVVRVLSLTGIFIFNGLMWTLFTKSLQLCSSSVEATVTNTAANFLTTALVSRFLFKEQLPLLWFGGSLFILIGLLLIHIGAQKTKVQSKKKKHA